MKTVEVLQIEVLHQRLNIVLNHFKPLFLEIKNKKKMPPKLNCNVGN